MIYNKDLNKKSSTQMSLLIKMKLSICELTLNNMFFEVFPEPSDSLWGLQEKHTKYGKCYKSPE